MSEMAAAPKNTPHRAVKAGSIKLWALIVFGVGILTRLLVILFYLPVRFSDTPSYRRLAQAVLGGFATYDGTRTPGYPVFLALVGDDQRVWMVQLFLGLVTSMLLFYIGWKISGKAWFGGLIGLAHTLNLGQLFFESNLLTETLTTFLLVLAMTGVLLWLYHPQHPNPWLAFLIGLTSTLTLLVRPLFIYLPFYTLLFLGFSAYLVFRRMKAVSGADPWSTNGSSGHSFWKTAIAFLVPVVLLMGGWVTFIHAKFGDWSLTTMTGYHLIQHTGSYFESVPDEFAALRDTYLKFRDAQVARYGTQTNAIWEAIPEMSQVSGYNFYDLSRVLAKISIRLILEHPWLFLMNALQGWWMFWRTAVYWSADALRFPGLSGGIDLLITLQRGILFLTNLIFVIGSAYFGITAGYRSIFRKPRQSLLAFGQPSQQAFFWFTAGVIWLASILQTLLDHGDNPRFLVPLQSVVVLWVALFIFLLILKRKEREPNEVGQS